MCRCAPTLPVGYPCTGRIDEGTGGISVRVPQAHRTVALGVVLALGDMAAAEVPGIVQTLRVASHGISRVMGAL